MPPSPAERGGPGWGRSPPRRRRLRRRQPLDTVTLAYDRHRRRLRLVTDAGSPSSSTSPEARVLRDGDRLVLDDGGLILVRAAPKAVFEIEADVPCLWLAGILAHADPNPARPPAHPRRSRAEHLLTDHLGAVVSLLHPFDPEGGAYAHDHAALYRLLAWLSPPTPSAPSPTATAWRPPSRKVASRSPTWKPGWRLSCATAAAGRMPCCACPRDGLRRRPGRVAAAAGARPCQVPTAELALETAPKARLSRRQPPERPDPHGRLSRYLAETSPTYPLAVGAVGLPWRPRKSVLGAYLQAFAANLVSAAVRLVPLGQTDGQHASPPSNPSCTRSRPRQPACPLDELGTTTLMVDLCSMRHETQYTRLFRCDHVSRHRRHRRPGRLRQDHAAGLVRGHAPP